MARRIPRDVLPCVLAQRSVSWNAAIQPWRTPVSFALARPAVGKDSTELLKLLKAGNAIGKTLVVSSNPRVESTKERMLLGVHNVIPKPYTQASLLSEVASALNSL